MPTFKYLTLLALALPAVLSNPLPIRRAPAFGVNLPAPDTNYDVNLSNGYRLIQFAPDEPPKWVHENEVATFTVEEHGFMDVTYMWENNYKSDFVSNFGEVVSGEKGYSFVGGATRFAANDTTTGTTTGTGTQTGAAGGTPKVSQENLVKAMFSKIDLNGMKQNIQTFIALPNRSFKAQEGVKSATWLFDRATELLGKAGTTQKIAHPFPQFSIIATIPGASKEKVILGSHQDSISNGATAPGADDDASGSMSVLEVMRLVGQEVTAGTFKPAKTLEFHWYAGEEGGLLGSQDIAQQYKQRNEQVAGMMQLDMTGFAKDPANRRIALMTDFTDPGLVSFAKTLMSTYTTTPVVDSKCGFGCSDHASWTRAGFKSVLPAEGVFEEITPFIHTVQDTFDKLNFDHMTDFLKLATGFVVELGSDGQAQQGGAAGNGTNTGNQGGQQGGQQGGNTGNQGGQQGGNGTNTGNQGGQQQGGNQGGQQGGNTGNQGGQQQAGVAETVTALKDILEALKNSLATVAGRLRVA